MTPAASEEPTGVQPAIAVTLEQLDANATPQSSFDRKLVELTAKVAQPGQLEYEHDAMGVALTGNGKRNAILGASPFVTALFPSDGDDSTRLRTLSPFQEVTVTGELRMAAENVWELHGAKLVKTGDDMAVSISAMELTQAFVADDEAAFARYRDQALKIRGTVIGKPFRFGEYAAVSLSGATDGAGRTTTVICQFRPDHFNVHGAPPLSGTSLADALPWQVGDEIEVIGTLQLADFGETQDGQPGLAVVAYPTKWPVK